MLNLNFPPKLLDQTYLDLPFPRHSSRLRYLLSYYGLALPAVLRPHLLHLSKTIKPYRSHFIVTRSEQQRWFDLFDLDTEKGKAIPFTYATTSATLVFMHLLSELGINFKYIRHVSSDIDFVTDNPALKPNHYYSYTVELSDLFALSSGRVMLELSSHIFDEEDQSCAKHTDYFMASDFKEEQLLALRASHPSDKQTRFEKVSAYTGQLSHNEIPLRAQDNMGVIYGQLSGDMNIVHTTPLAARLMGYPKPFIQGFCTVNLILSQLASQKGLELRQLQCTLTRPIFVGEKLNLFFQEDRFELVNSSKKIVAYGIAKTS